MPDPSVVLCAESGGLLCTRSAGREVWTAALKGLVPPQVWMRVYRGQKASPRARGDPSQPPASSTELWSSVGSPSNSVKAGKMYNFGKATLFFPNLIFGNA